MLKKIFVVCALLMALPLAAKQPIMPTKATLAAPTVQTIDGSVLKINIGSDNSYQVFNKTLPNPSRGQIFPSDATQTADMGWFVDINNTLYAPNFAEHPGGTATANIGAYTPFNEVSQLPVSGAGTADDPFTTRIVSRLGPTNITASHRVYHIDGSNYFIQQLRLFNPTPVPLAVTVFLGSDIYLATSDSGVPYREPSTNSPGGQTCAGVNPVYTILHIPLTPATRSTANQYANVWSQIGGANLDNSTATGCIDNGAALQWNLTIPGSGSVAVQAATSFGQIPSNLTQFNVANVNPAQGALGATLDVTISGTGFQPGTTFSFGNGITVAGLTVQNATTATATLIIDGNATPGFRDVIGTQSPGGARSTLYEGFIISERPVFNYMVSPLNANAGALSCTRLKFPGNPTTNLQGWAPSEGRPSFLNPITGIYEVGDGLALAIEQCFIQPVISPSFCNGGNGFVGEYPFREYVSVWYLCALPGGTTWEFRLGIDRIEYFPPPLLLNGFEFN